MAIKLNIRLTDEEKGIDIEAPAFTDDVRNLRLLIREAASSILAEHHRRTHTKEEHEAACVESNYFSLK
jgi:hypothetical protein